MRKPFRFTWILVALICIYFGWIYYSQWREKNKLINNLEEKKASQERPLSDVYGGGKFAILNFYTTFPSIRRGETSQLCYGVSGAEKIRIEPPAGNVWPSFSRCVDVAPTDDTTYVLTAEDADGNTVTAEATIKVNRE